ncbi:Tyrosine kinase [Ceratobasidium sp. AG-Ba]|nr:Tyrosine kinase [Ceratobasidium sp. AG-Ba]
MDQQNEKAAPIFNGRSYTFTGLPVQLFHPVFDHFLQALEATDQLTALEYKNVQKLAFTAQQVYHNEGDRWKQLISRFIVSLDSAILRDNPVENWTSLYFTIIEVKNEVGTGSCDPSIQAAEDYGICWSRPDVSSIRESCCCPSLFIIIAGPWMCIFGAVYLEYVTVQQLTDYIWLGHHPQQEKHLRRLTRVFRAAKDCIIELSSYYAALSNAPPTPLDPMRFFPHVRQYDAPDGTVTEFTYTGYIDKSTSRPVFTALTKSKKDIIVKFSERYNIAAHRLLAEKRLAPAVLFYGSPKHSQGLHCIIMERVPSVSLHKWYTTHTTSVGLEKAQKDVQTALETLHSKNWVFGDLRSPNVLIIGQEDSTRGMLVDFDWCGQDGLDHYPATMNDDQTIDWPDGAERGGLMKKEHDLDMFNKLFK